MTENTNVEIASPSQTQAPVAPSHSVTPVAEKMLPQSQVNELVGRTKNESYEKGKQDAQAEWQKSTPPTINAPSQTMGGMPQYSQADIDKLITGRVQEVLQHQQQQASQDHYLREGQRIAGEINSKLTDAKSRYEDFDNVVTTHALNANPEIMFLANGMENTGDVAYDLFKHPTKVAMINTLLAEAKRTNSPYFYDAAMNQLREISGSIKTNQAAVANHPHVNNPLSQVKPSNVGVDNGSKTISDIRRKPQYRV